MTLELRQNINETGTNYRFMYGIETVAFGLTYQAQNQRFHHLSRKLVGPWDKDFRLFLKLLILRVTSALKILLSTAQLCFYSTIMT